MGMTSNVIGIGTFRRSIVPFLEYSEERYANTCEGVTIAQNVFFIETGSTDSRKLAACLHIDPWDFNQHELDASTADLAGLRDLFGEESVCSFVALRDAGFRFFFLPNG